MNEKQQAALDAIQNFILYLASEETERDRLYEVALTYVEDLRRAKSCFKRGGSMKTQHTPGSWYVCGFGEEVRTIIDDEIYNICTVENDETGNAYENARLMAAAPDLLKALEVLLPIAARIIQGTTDGKPILEQARAAIEYATGKESKGEAA